MIVDFCSELGKTCNMQPGYSNNLQDKLNLETLPSYQEFKYSKHFSMKNVIVLESPVLSFMPFGSYVIVL